MNLHHTAFAPPGPTGRAAVLVRAGLAGFAGLAIAVLTACSVGRAPVAPVLARPAVPDPTPGPAAGPDDMVDPGQLTRDMQQRVDRALAAAAAEGVPIRVTSGWRSVAEQESLFRAAVVRYGSTDAASRWVLPPRDSAHVRGLAVDVAPAAGASWLGAHGATYGLCRRYDNEPWHFEPLVAPGGSCPTRDPYPVAR